MSPLLIHMLAARRQRRGTTLNELTGENGGAWTGHASLAHEHCAADFELVDDADFGRVDWSALVVDGLDESANDRAWRGHRHGRIGAGIAVGVVATPSHDIEGCERVDGSRFSRITTCRALERLVRDHEHTNDSGIERVASVGEPLGVVAWIPAGGAAAAVVEDGGAVLGRNPTSLHRSRGVKGPALLAHMPMGSWRSWCRSRWGRWRRRYCVRGRSCSAGPS